MIILNGRTFKYSACPNPYMNAAEKAIEEICQERNLTREQLLKTLPWLKAGIKK
jgi:7-keto-8-aminopelargonate synthetase-like enzyme